MATFHLLNFGCRASQADGAALKNQLLQAGLEEVGDVGRSQIAVLNTCTVTAAADAEVRQMIRRIQRANPSCRILVTGCYAQRAPQEIARLEGVAWVVGNSHKHAIAEILSGKTEEAREKSGARSQVRFLVRSRSDHRTPAIGESEDRHDHELFWIQPAASSAAVPDSASRRSAIPDSRFPVPEILVGEITEDFHFAPVFPDDRTRPTLKVQDGCNARCAFCVIPSVRGRSRSLPPETVVAQVRELERQGCCEIVLSGINLGSYGKDLGRSITFLGLLEKILEETAIPRLRISSIEPMDVSAALIRLVAREPRLARHLHVPLQSGCDRILRLMRRRYWASQYAERLLALHEAMPNGGLGADVMVGFPGESDQDHATSARFIASLPFTYLHIFPYSARPGTPAASSPGQVNGRIARERSQELRAIIARKRAAFLAAQVGRSLSALTLDESVDGARVSLTSNYLKVALPGSSVPPNRVLDVWVGRVHGPLLYGSPQA